MDPSGFFLLHIPAAGREGYNVRLRWVEGLPAITDAGGAGPVLVNGAPLQPGMPYLIQAGDEINLGDAHLTWHALPEAAAAAPPEATPQSADRPQTVASAERATAPPPPAYSLLIKTATETTEFPLTAPVVRIGRAPDNDIWIDDERVSRHHARLVQRADSYEIIDLGSANGLKMGQERISRRLLAPGDVVRVSGAATLTFQVSHPQEREDMSPPAKERAPDETVAAPRATSAAPAAGTTRDATEPAGEPAPDATVVAPRGAVEAPAAGATQDASPSTGERAPDETIVAPRRASAEPATGVTQDATQPAAQPAPDATVAAPRGAAEPATPGDPTPAPESPQRTPEDAQEQAGEMTVVAPRTAGEAVTVLAPKQDGPPPGKGAAPEAATVVGAPGGGAETELVDMAEILRQDPSLRVEAGTIIRDTSIPRLVIHLPDRTWEAQFTSDHMTVGREQTNDIPIPDPSVSRHHASIERHGEAFVISEAQSRNGLWLDKQRVQEHRLRDGDVLSLGRARLVFKAGFTADDLTLIGPPRIDGQPRRRPVVFVPGLGGSELWLGSERLWPNPKVIISHPEVYRLPGDPRIEARNIVSDVVIVPNIIKQQQYSRLGDYLETGLGYRRGNDLLEFAYDWRQDIRLASQRLAERIERWGVDAPITIIAHSLGTLVTRYYVERLGGKKRVERIILMGGPHYGAPKGLAAILVGPGILPFGVGDEGLRDALSTFPSAYQILPIYPSVTDQHGNTIDVLKDDSWLPEQQRPFLRAARSFRRELGLLSSVPTVSIFGYGLKTIVRVKIHRRPDGQWGKVEYIEDMAGDLSVPSGSAVLKESEIHPVFQEHGSLYVDDDVKMRLKVELTRSTTWQRSK
jgi:pSer/pThr/pTyr-binding forkhead associated (FHA) protein